VPFPVNNLVLHRQGAENAKSISVFCTHNFLVCLVSWWLKNTSSFLRNGTSISHLSMTFVGNSLNLEVTELNPKNAPFTEKKYLLFLFILFRCLYLFFISSPHYNTLGFRSIKSKDPVENPSSLWISVNLGATLCRKRAVSQRNTEAVQGTTEKKPRVELIGRISKQM